MVGSFLKRVYSPSIDEVTTLDRQSWLVCFCLYCWWLEMHINFIVVGASGEWS
jgi:hypothetical protein